MPCNPVDGPEHYLFVTGRPQLTIVHFLHLAGPESQEIQLLQLVNVDTFYVDVSELSVPDAPSPSDVPVTILFRENQKLDTAKGGDMPKLIELVDRAEGGS